MVNITQAKKAKYTEALSILNGLLITVKSHRDGIIATHAPPDSKLNFRLDKVLAEIFDMIAQILQLVLCLLENKKPKKLEPK